MGLMRGKCSLNPVPGLYHLVGDCSSTSRLHCSCPHTPNISSAACVCGYNQTNMFQPQARMSPHICPVQQELWSPLEG